MGQSNGHQAVKLKGLWAASTRRPNGRPYWYVRRKGLPLYPLPDLPENDPAFLAAYVAAWAIPVPTRAMAEKQNDGGLGRAIEDAMRTAKFRDLSVGYRKGLRREWDALKASYGTLPLSGLREHHVQRDVSLASNPCLRLKAWRFLTIPGNPARSVKPQTKKTTGHEVWTLDEVEAFRARWPIGSAARAGMELLFWTACRISDGVRIGRGNVGPDGILAYRQKKTDGMAYVPWSSELPSYAAGWELDRQMMHEALAAFSGHFTFFPTVSGKSRSDKAFGTLIATAARAAGIEKSAHGLRKARSKLLADAGATTHQIAAWTGHESLKEVERYTREADRRRAVSSEKRISQPVRNRENR